MIGNKFQAGYIRRADRQIKDSPRVIAFIHNGKRHLITRKEARALADDLESALGLARGDG